MSKSKVLCVAVNYEEDHSVDMRYPSFLFAASMAGFVRAFVPVAVPARSFIPATGNTFHTASAKPETARFCKSAEMKIAIVTVRIQDQPSPSKHALVKFMMVDDGTVATVFYLMAGV